MNYIEFNKNLNKTKFYSLNIFIDETSQIADGVKIFSGVNIVNSTICQGCEIGTNSKIKNSHLNKGVLVEASYIDDCYVGEDTTIGPFATLKKGAKIGANCRVGNFVEIKNSTLGDGAKVAHLAYVGDCEIGNGCNIGCGVVFCNYNGKQKFRSKVGNNVFIGSNVNVVAPVEIQDGAYIAAGSTITKDVLKNQFSIARERQINKNNFNNPFTKK